MKKIERPYSETPQGRYNNKNTRVFTFRLNYKYDEEIINLLDEKIKNGDSMASYLKKLIREDIKNKNIQ